MITVERVRQGVTKTGRSAGQPYAIVETAEEGTYFAFGKVGADILRDIGPGTKADITAQENGGRKQITAFTKVGSVEAYVSKFAKEVPVEVNNRDRTMLTRYVLDSRIAGLTKPPSRIEARTFVLESYQDAKWILANADTEPKQNALESSALRIAAKLKIDTASPNWAAYLKWRFGDDMVPADWGQLLTDLNAAEDGRKEVRITPEGRLAFVDVEKK